MKPFELNAETRTAQGRAENRRLRRQGKVPAIIYGGAGEPLMLSFDHDDLSHHLANEAFYSHVIKINVPGGKPEEVVLRDLQRHPARPFVQHVDLLRVVAGEALRMNVPLHFIGEDDCPGIKEEGGIATHSMNDVEVECLPRNLPEYIEVDCSALAVNDALHLSDLKLPEGVELVDLMHETDRTVVTIQLPRAALELEEEEAAEAEAAAEEAAAEEEAGDDSESDEDDSDSEASGDDEDKG
ncbi:50S ribosomal protein L25/general stress protein Ctc [Spectribacter hydrogenoxidans]|uniref:Large ribosomal subunit protein bL25 n=1 Tax=Spectribacter hydrogenoxidans TaxID=3075608 RepID=A0ABU3C486_9GAMM|nr:50S ribosomal protein L25/general stress protein Ctc [Salinisphaera sp. W335]MDT0636355.1 50S ribosomal protein L25/general stress protein Ctc [Salinisphaera sp. W335]